jgi:hypothetical protein
VVLITSRNQLTGLLAAEGAHPITLGLLSTEEAHDLLARHLGPARLAAEPAATSQLITQCALLPLALTVVAVRAAARPTFPLATFTRQLADARHRLDAINAGSRSTSLRAVFSWSYQQLSTPAARLFRLLGLHPGPDISSSAAVSLASTSITDTWLDLEELTDSNLLTEHAPGRYALHDLLRTYATDMTNTHDSETERRDAMHRMLDHYLHTAHTATKPMISRMERMTLPPPVSGVTPEELSCSEDVLAWFDAEHPVLLAAIDHAANTGFDTHVWQLAWTLHVLFHRSSPRHNDSATGTASRSSPGTSAPATPDRTATTTPTTTSSEPSP